MPETKADPKAISPHSSTHFEQSVQSRERRHHAPAGCSEKRLSPAGTSPDPPLIDYVSNAPPQKDEKPRKKRKRYLGRCLTGNATNVSAARPGLTSQSDAAALSRANELERQIKDLETQTYEVALLLSRGTDKTQKKDLHLKLYHLEKNIREKQELLKKYKTKTQPAKVPEESSADPLSPAPDNTTLLAQHFQKLSVREQPPPKCSPASSSQYGAHRQEAAFSDRMYGLDHHPSTPVPAKSRRPETQESAEDEWMDIEIEDAEEPLGQEEWEDDIASDLIPHGAAQNPYYPGTGRILWSGVPRR